MSSFGMSAQRLARAVKPPFGRSTAVSASVAAAAARRLSVPSVPATPGMVQLSTSAIRRSPSGAKVFTKSASTWSSSGVVAIAVAAGVLGWSLASVKDDKGFPSAILLDSKIAAPKYASMREMELVRKPVPAHLMGL